MQHSASHHKASCSDNATKRTDYKQKHKGNDVASQPRRALKERNTATTHSLQDGQAVKTITGQNQKEQKIKETNQTKEQWLEAGRLALVQDKIRKALAPFFTICQSTTQQKLQQQQCRQADQSIIAALKADRDAKFAKMGTWKITKQVSRNGSVCDRTEATDKLCFLPAADKRPSQEDRLLRGAN